MKATLFIPSPPTLLRTYKLARRRTAAGWACGLTVADANFCRVLNGVIFQDLRDVLGARIETDDAELVTQALRLQNGEPGILQLNDAEMRCR